MFRLIFLLALTIFLVGSFGTSERKSSKNVSRGYFIFENLAGTLVNVAVYSLYRIFCSLELKVV